MAERLKMRQMQFQTFKMLSSAVVAGVLLLSSSLSFAASARKTTTASANRLVRKTVAPMPTQTPAPKSWSIPITYETSSTLHAADTYEREAVSALAITPSVKLSPNTKLGTNVTIYKEHTGAGNTSFDNTPISLSYRMALTPTIAWTNMAAVILPTNRQLQDETTYQGAARVGTTFSFDELFLGSSFSYAVSLTRNVHELQQSNTGGFNMRETVNQALNHSLPLGRDWSFDTSFAYTYGWTYLDDSRSKFYAGVNLNWNFSKDWTASVGTSNEGNALKPNGSDSNIEFYNDNSSVVKFSLTYVL